MNSTDNKGNRIKIAVLNIVLCGIMLTLATGCGKTGSGDEEARIVFGEVGAFRLGETQEIGYSFPDGQDREVSVRNVPSGWQASVDNDANAISLTCGGTETSAELVFRSEIVQGSPFFIGNEPVGVVVLEKTANSDGIIIYKEMPVHYWDDCVDWIETLRETTHLQWEMPGNEDYEVIYEIFNGSDSSTPNAKYQDRFSKWFLNINGDSHFSATTIYFWSQTIVTDNTNERYTFAFTPHSSHNWIIPGTPRITSDASSADCMAMLKF